MAESDEDTELPGQGSALNFPDEEEGFVPSGEPILLEASLMGVGLAATHLPERLALEVEADRVQFLSPALRASQKKHDEAKIKLQFPERTQAQWVMRSHRRGVLHSAPVVGDEQAGVQYEMALKVLEEDLPVTEVI